MRAFPSAFIEHAIDHPVVVCFTRWLAQVAVLNSGRLQKALAQTMADGQMNAKEMAEKLANTTPTHELEQQAQELQFQVSVTAAAGTGAPFFL